MPENNGYRLRSLQEADIGQFCDMLLHSFNTWYKKHGLNDQYFRCPPEDLRFIYDVYQDLDPDLNVGAFEARSGKLMGACFYHPREHHVSLGVMSVHPDYWKRGVGSALMSHIVDYVESSGRKSLRITQSACNVDSFSLYSRKGAFARAAYHDMIFHVPPGGMRASVPGRDKVRRAALRDAAAMADLEFAVSGITRMQDYLYCIENKTGFWNASVLETEGGGLEGFIISCGHPSFNMLGPCVARSEAAATALVLDHLDLYPGRSPIVLIPVDKQELVRALYANGARNVEMHFYQVRGAFNGFNGVSIPSFLPETG